MPSLILLNIIGGVALLLFGLRLVRNGVTRAFGVQLRRIISMSTSNRLKAFGAGMLVTSILQSSTATTMIIATFAGQGLISTASALAVVLGADVGTTLVAQVMTMNVGFLSPLLLITGYFFYAGRESAGAGRQVGRILVGLGLMLLALSLIKAAAQPLKESELLPKMLAPLDHDPMFAVLVGVILTWLCHSSLAIILLIVSLVSSALVPLHLALLLVLGANIGTVIAPLISSFKDSPGAVRIPAGNLIMRLIGVFLILAFVREIQILMDDMGKDPVRQVVNFHLAFNVALAILFLPFLPLMEKLLYRFIPDRHDPEDPGTPKYLDQKVLDTPTVALTNASRESLRIADLVDQMLQIAWDSIRRNDEALIQRAKALDVTVDKLYKAVKMYLVQLGQEAMTPQEARRHFQILTFATNLEHVGDIIDRNLLSIAQKKTRNQKFFSSEGQQELDKFCSLVLDSIRLAQTVFISGDTKLARQLVEDKAAIKQAETKAAISHMLRMQSGNPDTLATSDLHNDVIRDLRRINSLMASVAYPILEEAGELRPSLLKGPEVAAAKEPT